MNRPEGKAGNFGDDESDRRWPPAGHCKALAESCTLCHGPDVNAVNPMTPKLAGQNELYLIQALQDDRAELRPNNRPMTLLAKKMSDTDIEDLAAWFASTKAVDRGLAAGRQARKSPGREPPRWTKRHLTRGPTSGALRAVASTMNLA